MSKIFEAAGDVVDDTVDFVTDNKEIIAAITLAYMTGGASVPETTAAATAEATAAAVRATTASDTAVHASSPAFAAITHPYISIKTLCFLQPLP